MNDADSVDVGWTRAAQARLGAAGRVWQVNTRGRKVVEMGLAELAASVKSGKLSGKSLVWCDGMAAWTPLGEVTDLKRIVQDSEPPTSGARLIADEAEPLAGTKSYVSAGSEPPTDPGTLAVYERPLATIEFPDAIDALPESVDEPTPAFGATTRAEARTTLPGLAPEDLVPLPSSTRLTAPEPAVPPLPPRLQAGFPFPVSSSPLGAALSSMARSNPTATPLPDGRAKPQPDVTSYAVAKATPIPSSEALKQALSAADEAAVSTPRPLAPSASTGAVQKPPTPSPSGGALQRAFAPSTSGDASPKPFASTVISATPPKAVFPAAASAALKLSSPPATKPLTPSSSATTAPNAATPAAAPTENAAPAAPPKLPSSLVPRPAIEFLPPIIVQEKEDDGASIITLPLDANFHESTLVLAGRRRQRRWVPLGAAIAAAVGAACLASALTALVVRSRTPMTRIVEKRVLIPVAATPAAAADAPAPLAAGTVATPPAERAAPPANSETAKPAATERISSKSESSGAPAKPWRKDDPGALEQAASSSARRELRAGFPTNPGF